MEATAPAPSAPAAAIPVPSHAAWFDFDAISDLERRALPEFFVGGAGRKTADTYRAARNFVVQTYRAQPALYLSYTECRRNLACDAGLSSASTAFSSTGG